MDYIVRGLPMLICFDDKTLFGARKDGELSQMMTREASMASRWSCSTARTVSKVAVVAVGSHSRSFWMSQ